eukprot:jgi/Chlat1/8806/Chrsp90S08142
MRRAAPLLGTRLRAAHAAARRRAGLASSTGSKGSPPTPPKQNGAQVHQPQAKPKASGPAAAPTAPKPSTSAPSAPPAAGPITPPPPPPPASSRRWLWTSLTAAAGLALGVGAVYVDPSRLPPALQPWQEQLRQLPANLNSLMRSVSCGRIQRPPNIMLKLQKRSLMATSSHKSQLQRRLRTGLKAWRRRVQTRRILGSRCGKRRKAEMLALLDQAAAAVAAAAAQSAAQDASRLLADMRAEAEARVGLPTTSAQPSLSEQSTVAVDALLENAKQQQQAVEPASVDGAEGERAVSEDVGAVEEWRRAQGLVLVEAIRAAEQRQAQADAIKFNEVLKQRDDETARALQAAHDEAARRAQQVKQLQERLEVGTKAMRSALEEQRRAAELRLTQALAHKEQDAQAKVEAAIADERVKTEEGLLQERMGRMKAIDDLRMKINALQQAFSRRSDEAHQSHKAHMITMGASALSAAADEGRPFKAEAELLLSASHSDEEGDPFVLAILSSLPHELAERGAPTRTQLADRFAQVKRNARQVALVPENGGGVLTYGLAHVASKLKLPEYGAYLPEGGGSEAVLARAEAHLTAGNLAGAADELQSGLAGSAASAAAKDWVAAARERALVEQNLAALRAHAVTLAAGLT